MQITEKWLGEIGGWQAMKAARDYVRLGAVSEDSQQGNEYAGLVGQGARKFRAVLTVKDARNVDCRCACNEARRGLICAHGLAVALVAISGSHPGAPAGTSSPSAGSSWGARSSTGYAASSTPPRRPSASDPRGFLAKNVTSAPPPEPATLDLNTVPAGKFTVYISTDHFDQLPQGTVPIFLEFTPGGETKDIELATWLFARGLKVQSAPLRIPGPDLAELFTALRDHPRVIAGLPQKGSKGSSDGINNAKSLTFSNLHFSSDSLRVYHQDAIHFQLTEKLLTLLSVNNHRWVSSKASGTIMLAEGQGVNKLKSFLDELFTSQKASRPPRWVAANLASLAEVIDVEASDSPLSKVRIIPVDPMFELKLDGSLRKVEATLTVHATASLAHPITLGAPDREWRDTDLYPIPDPDGVPLRFRHRNTTREQAAWNRVEQAGFRMDAQGMLSIQGETEVFQFLAAELPRLRSLFQITEGEGWRSATRGLSTIRPQMRTAQLDALTRSKAGAKANTPGSDGPELGLSTGMDWLTLEVAYEAPDGFRIPRQEVLRLIRSGKRDFRANNGKRYLLDIDGCEDLEETLQDVESKFGQGGQTIAVRSRQMEVLADFLPAEPSKRPVAAPELSTEEIKTLLSDLGNMLRPYQLEGVKWLERHARSSGAGLLADEMGLGKTVQTLSLLRIIRARVNAKKGAGDPTDPIGPALVICPTSLLSNWSEEAARFTPELKTHISHEVGRKEMLGKLTEFDVVFTSYALIIRDLEYYRDINFCSIVLDEASYIRNPDTAAAKSLCQLKAVTRFALTGTPVENSVKDLWSVFTFLMPRYLPVLEDFNSRFVKPLGQGNTAQSRAVMERLRRLTRPYLFRRTKREVAKDLPEKIEKVVWCELTREQKEVYQRILDEGREEIRSARKRAGQGSARMTMFTVLLRLRQVSNDLRLLNLGAAVEGAKKGSAALEGGKWPMLEELLTEIIDGGGKALIFSQFVGMLRLIREKVEKLGIPYSYLDGSTQDRGAQVSAFQSDPNKKLFLISLKAGGYGLNLTAADNVLLVDPWWNPAVEAQAIDRAHRIGQGKPVTAYRLAARGTVEEKILKLQEKKRSIMDMTLEDDPAIMAGVTDDELEAMIGL